MERKKKKLKNGNETRKQQMLTGRTGKKHTNTNTFNTDTDIEIQEKKINSTFKMAI